MKKNPFFCKGEHFYLLKKILVIMKITTLLLLVGLVQVGATGYSQSKKFTFNAENISIKDLISIVEQKSQYKFVYRNSDVENTMVTINSKNSTINEMLDYALTGSGKSFKMLENDLIVILPFEKIQKTTVKGLITDAATGEGIPGVNVEVKGTDIGTISDMDGKYSLDIDDPNSTLIFSYIGYTTKEVAVSGQAIIDVQLETSDKQISEVVVIGYGTVKKSDLTGAVATVKAESLQNISAGNLNEALQGKVAGVYVTKDNGRPGGGGDIIIRGATSINGAGPLYVVDGVRMGTGFNFNIKDIASIEILKDAGSAAIYGAQSANGVILITTNRGAVNDKMKIDFSARYGANKAVNMNQLLSTPDFIRAKQNAGWNYPSWSSPSSLPNTDWVDRIFDSGSEQEYNLSLSGGTNKANYFLSTNYLKQDGIVIDNTFERYGFRLNSDFNINKHLKVGESLYTWFTKENPAANGQIPYRSVPTMEVYDPSNPIGGWAKHPAEGYFEGGNPIANEESLHQKNNEYAIESNVYLDVKIIEGLNFRTTFAAALGSYNDAIFNEGWDFGSLSRPQAEFRKHSRDWQNYMANFVLTYKKTFDKHDLGLMVGYEALKSLSTEMYGFTSNFLVPVAESFNLSVTPESSRTATGSVGNGRVLSQFGRLNYSYDGKYLLSAVIRRDGSDKFGSENKWGVFPSVNLGWNISKESFMESVSAISNLKLRGGWGILGSDNLGQFLYEPAYSSMGVHNFGSGSNVSGWGVSKFPNENIKWEEVHSIDIGLDLGFLSNQLEFTIDYYNRKTIDMIYQLNIPISSGIGGHNGYPQQVPINLGEIENKGMEFSVAYHSSIGDLKYNVIANAYYNKNVVNKISDDATVALFDGSAGDTWNSSLCKTINGEPLGQFWGYKVDGIFQTQAEVDALKPDATGFYQNAQTGPGDLKYADLNGDDVITEKDKTFIGNPWPKLNYGFTVQLEYKGFDFSFFLQGISGNDVFNGTKAYTENFFGDYNTTSDVFGASNFGSNGVTGQPRLGFTDGNSYFRDPNGNFKNPSSYFIESGSFLKLRNIQLGYRLPSSLLGKAKMSSARVFVTGQNLFTISKYSGMDPEIGGGVRSRGIDNIYIYPQIRQIAFGIEIGF